MLPSQQRQSTITITTTKATTITTMLFGSSGEDTHVQANRYNALPRRTETACNGTTTKNIATIKSTLLNHSQQNKANQSTQSGKID